MTPPLDALKKALSDVDNLIDHHPKTAAPTRGRPTTDEGPLLRSCIVLTYAAWEVYIEDGLIWAVEQLVQDSAPERLPEAMRTYVASSLKKNSPWQLAGEGWRSTAVDLVTKQVHGTDDGSSFGMNTAGPDQVIKLQREVLGTCPLHECSWQGVSNDKALKDLQQFVQIRGSIAHTGQTPAPLHLQGVRAWRSFVERLAGAHDRNLDSWVEDVLRGSASP